MTIHDTTEEPRFWAPWKPSPGQRVRVRASLECVYCFDPRFPGCYERALADDGRTATVYDLGHAECPCRFDDDPDPAHAAHDVWVKWDERRPHDEPVWAAPFDAHFAAIELEPLP